MAVLSSPPNLKFWLSLVSALPRSGPGLGFYWHVFSNQHCLISQPANCTDVRYVLCLSILVPCPWHSFMSCIKSGQTFHMWKTLKPCVWLERLTAVNGNLTEVELIVTCRLRVLMLREAVCSINCSLAFLLLLSFLSLLSPSLLLLSIWQDRWVLIHMKIWDPHFDKIDECSYIWGSEILTFD